MEAEIVIGLCERFRCLPSELLQEDAYLLGMAALVDYAHPKESGGG